MQAPVRDRSTRPSLRSPWRVLQPARSAPERATQPLPVRTPPLAWMSGAASALDLAQYARILTGLLWLGWADWWTQNTEIGYGALAGVLQGAAALAVIALAVVVRSDEGRRRLDLFLITGTLLTIALVSVAGGTASGYGTDELDYDQAAAGALLHGINPYTADFTSALKTFGTQSGTITLHGTVVPSIAYPALSFLLYVPFVALTGSHSYAGLMTDIIAWLLAGGMLWRMMDARVRTWVPVFLGLPFLLSTVMGGGTDPLYIPFALIAVCCWDRYGDPSERSAARWVGPIALGLACCIKQPPWLLAPFLVLGVGLEAHHRGQRWQRVAGRYVLVAATAFLAPNIPFILWDHGAWLTHILLPMTEAIVPMGLGVAAMIRAYNIGGANLSLFALSSVAMLAGMIALFAWRYQAMKRLLPFLPLVALFVSSRSFPSYFTYALPAAVIAAASVRSVSGVTMRPALARGFRSLFVVGVAGSLAALAVAFITPSPLRVLITSAHTDETLFTATVRLTNGSGAALSPHFILARDASWNELLNVVSGPASLAPGASGVYSLEAPTELLTPTAAEEFQIEATSTSPNTFSVSSMSVVPGKPAI